MVEVSPVAMNGCQATCLSVAAGASLVGAAFVTNYGLGLPCFAVADLEMAPGFSSTASTGWGMG